MGPLRRNQGSIFFRPVAARQFFAIVLPSCCLAFSIFSTIFYLNSDHIVDLYHSVIASPPPKTSSSSKEPVKIILPKRHLSKYDLSITYKDYNYLNSTSLTYKKRTYSNNISILYRLPRRIRTRALLLIFHGCGRRAHDWFNTIERQRIVGAAIDLGYGCLAFQSTNEHNRCWSSSTEIYENDDVQMVSKGLEEFFKEHPKYESLPLFTFGASSGGIFSSVFVINQRYKIRGQILFISIILPEVVETYVKRKTYPPTAWIYMPRDIEFASKERINSSITIFQREGIPYTALQIDPIALTPSTFHNRIPTITSATSNYIFYRLQQNQWLDSDNVLVYNPRRRNDWQTFLYAPTNQTSETQNILNNLKKHSQILPDFFNTIYGEHEISYERSFEALQWHKQLYFNKTQSNLS